MGPWLGFAVSRFLRFQIGGSVSSAATAPPGPSSVEDLITIPSNKAMSSHDNLI